MTSVNNSPLFNKEQVNIIRDLIDSNITTSEIRKVFWEDPEFRNKFPDITLKQVITKFTNMRYNKPKNPVPIKLSSPVSRTNMSILDLIGTIEGDLEVLKGKIKEQEKDMQTILDWAKHTKEIEKIALVFDNQGNYIGRR